MSTTQSSETSKTPDLEAVLARHGFRIVIALAVLFVLVYGVACMVKYHHFMYWDIDLAHHVQECHNILNGSLFNTLLGINFLGNHFALIMFPVTVLYALVRSPMTLLVLQVLAAASAAVPLYLMMRRLLNATAGVALALVYLAHPALGYTVLYEFHPVVFAGAFLMWALWAFPFGGRRGHFKAFIIFALLGLASRESFSLVLIMLGIYAAIFVKERRKKWAISSLGLGLVWLVVVMLILMPRLNMGRVGFANIYKDEWGQSVPEIAGNVLSNPVKTVQFIYSTPGATQRALTDTELKQTFLMHLFTPVLLLSLISPSTLLLAAPILLQHMLSARLQEHTILRHYTALLLPIVMVSTGMGLRNLLGWMMPPRSAERLDVLLDVPGRLRLVNRISSAALVGGALVCFVAYGPLGPGSAGLRTEDTPVFQNLATPYHRLCRAHWLDMVGRVPANVPVVSTFAFQARLADREKIYSYHHLYKGTYTLSDERFELPEGIGAALVDFADPLLVGSWRDFDAGARMRAFFEREQLEPTMSAGSTVLFERTPGRGLPLYEELDEVAGLPRIDQDYAGLVRLVSAEVAVPAVEPGGLLPVKLFWRSTSKTKGWLACRFHLVTADGRLVCSPPVFIPLGYNLYLPFEWPPERLVMQNISVPLPTDLVDGDVDVCLTVYVLRDARWETAAMMTEAGLQPVPPVRLGSVRVRDGGQAR